MTEADTVKGMRMGLIMIATGISSGLWSYAIHAPVLSFWQYMATCFPAFVAGAFCERVYRR